MKAKTAYLSAKATKEDKIEVKKRELGPAVKAAANPDPGRLPVDANVDEVQSNAASLARMEAGSPFYTKNEGAADTATAPETPSMPSAETS